MLKFDQIDEFKTRLSGTYLRYKDGICYSEIGANSFPTPNPDDWFVFLTDVSKKKEPVKVMNGDPEVRTDFKLGMVSGHESAFYVVRLPARKFKCGIFGENIRAFNTVDGSRSGISISTLVKNTSLIKTLNNEFTVYEEVEKMVQDGKVGSEPFSRHFALKWDSLRKDFVLIYKAQPVGFGRNRRFTLADDFKHLRESLEEQKVYA